MQEVEFHTGVADPLQFACRLLRKASRVGARVTVTAPPSLLAALDRELWTFEERDFIPHVRMPGTAVEVAARTPIWLAAELPAGAAAPRVVLNVGAAAPADLEGVERLIEIVAADPDEAEAGRARWRAYKAAGLAVRHHAADRMRE